MQGSPTCVACTICVPDRACPPPFRPLPWQAIAPLVPHYLMGIAAGAGVMGLFMIVCGFFQPLNSMPKVGQGGAGAGAGVAG